MPKDLLVRKYTGSERFKPHFNTTTGKRYHTKDEYVKDLKASGLEPYREGSAKPPAHQPYKLSQWGHDMVRAIRNTGKLERGSRIDVELRKRGQNIFAPPQRTGVDTRKGGFA